METTYTTKILNMIHYNTLIGGLQRITNSQRQTQQPAGVEIEQVSSEPRE